MPILKSSSICFICESSDIFSDELLKTINKIIKYLNKNFNGNIQYINYINKEKINELFYSQYTNQFKNRENEERIMQNGMKAQIKTYKNNKDVSKNVSKELVQCAKIVNKLDNKMLLLNS